ncbi:TIGR02678 family protein [Ralstonia pseudosolanacearum]|nr:TIGR02678 family protein [Ralstonia pseudosolanacearum]
MTPAHESFAAVRRHADELRAWFARETGWTLHIERDCARLYKRPADLQDASRGLPGYERRRYVLLCLACAVLERADPQITLRVLGDRLLALAADPALASRNFHFTLGAAHERRELVAVCRSLVELGVLQRIAGDEESFVRSTGDAADSGDALYDVRRRVLAGLLAAVRGPSTWPAEQTPVSLDERLASLVAEHMPDSDDGLRTALRHDLARRLLDNPVVYLNTLDAELRAYFVNQRGAMATRLCDATGLVAEQRAEGLALVDEDGELTDVAMPAEGTEAHATLLVAEFLAGRSRADAQAPTTLDEITAFLADARTRYGSYWRKSAREPGAERELTTVALERLLKLQLVARMADRIQPLPALARFALGETDIRAPIRSATQSNLFE